MLAGGRRVSPHACGPVHPDDQDAKTADEVRNAWNAWHPNCPAGLLPQSGTVPDREASASPTATPQQAPPRRDVPAPLPEPLTAREVEVLALIAQGLSNAEIGERLYLGRATVKTHINRIFAKTGARDRAQAVRYAYRTGLAD
ncbi:hypothetical protein Scani_80800 [Streptomyces caniferus]|uniref:HTH luxR-type domain-containing protein n=1 Tax=Streptomyces caniferus TaxID=285557 RepID=A0A640SM39_9ACTN|nr:hypothetical protein Scani_80800 [Streptomyces caniferus]